jgi:hypothetical protein
MALFFFPSSLWHSSSFHLHYGTLLLSIFTMALLFFPCKLELCFSVGEKPM